VTDITQEILKSLLDYNPDTRVFIWRVKPRYKIEIGSIAGGVTDEGYRRIRIRGKFYKEHRLAWLYVFGKFPDNMIDHINRNRADNRICNLRDVSGSVNQHNCKTRTDNTSGVKGVYWHKATQKWCAYIILNNKQKHIGLFITMEEAVVARQAAEKQLFLLLSRKL